jgi:hypothetical protein
MFFTEDKIKISLPKSGFCAGTGTALVYNIILIYLKTKETVLKIMRMEAFYYIVILFYINQITGG